MNIKTETMEKMLNRKCQTIRLYLDRAEFSHIQYASTKEGGFFANVTEEDLKTLKGLFDSRRCCRYVRSK